MTPWDISRTIDQILRDEDASTPLLVQERPGYGLHSIARDRLEFNFGSCAEFFIREGLFDYLQQFPEGPVLINVSKAGNDLDLILESAIKSDADPLIIVCAKTLPSDSAILNRFTVI